MLDIAEKQQVRIDIYALAARLGCPVIPLVSTRGRGIEALKIALDRHQANSDLELVHYPQPLLREADLLAQQMSAQIPPRQALAGSADAGGRYLQPGLCRRRRR
ncbi:Fe(2+) transporter FeoB [Klebsiella pneumoniae]|nr:Fe(2+) transporter FeoB [Klebsiella pneumoniae]